ncbi:hypothetical protein ACFVH0_20955 [Streptomyces sp. NPDC127117]|uniref:hypothetical protein n=1 Tax=Streptomyces sp. NPDC127117 TaxID=3345368 RepID=UPI0036253013
MTARTPAAPQLTNDEFDELIDQINAHHQATLAALTAGRPKPSPFVMPEGFDSVSNDYSDLPQDAIDAFAQSRERNTSQADGQKPHIADVSQQYENNKISKSSFDEQIDKQKKDNIDKFTDDQNKVADELKKSGSAHPEKQNEILQAFKDAGDWLIDKLWGAVCAFFKQLAEDIKRWWDSVVDWFKDKVDAVKNWWHSIFG